VAYGLNDTETIEGQSMPENMIDIQSKGPAIDPVYMRQPSSLDVAFIDPIVGSEDLRGHLYHPSATDSIRGIYIFAGVELFHWDGDDLENVPIQWIDSSGSPTGPPPNFLNSVKMASNGITIVAIDVEPGVDGDYYISVTSGGGGLSATASPINWATGGVYDTLSQGGADDVHFFDDYFVYISKANNRCFHGSLTTVTAGRDMRVEDFTQISRREDEVTAIFDIGGQLCVASSHHIDFFQNVGGVNFAFQRLKGQELNIGVFNRLSWCSTGVDVVFAGNTREGLVGVYSIKKGKISSESIDYLLGKYSQNSRNLYCFSFSDKGQVFAGVSTFTQDGDPEFLLGVTYVYNTFNSTWHKRSTRPVENGSPDTGESYLYWVRASYNQKDENGNIEQFLVGHYFTDKNDYKQQYIARFSDDYKGDFGLLSYDPNYYYVTTQVLENSGEDIRFSKIGIYSNGMNGAKVELQYTDDKGDFLSVGEVQLDSEPTTDQTRTEWRRLGNTDAYRLYRFSLNGRNAGIGDGKVLPPFSPYQIVKPFAEVKSRG